MGGEYFENTYVGTESPSEAFHKLVTNEQWEHGHGGYTGTIAEKTGFKMLEKPIGQSIDSFIDENIGRNDKWGPAFCFELKDADLAIFRVKRKLAPEPKPGERVYIFFGIASC